MKRNLFRLPLFNNVNESAFREDECSNTSLLRIFSRKFIQNVSTENVATISNLSKFQIFILIERQINNDEIMNKIQDKSLSRLDITENKRVDVRKILIMYIY